MKNSAGELVMKNVTMILASLVSLLVLASCGDTNSYYDCDTDGDVVDGDTDDEVSEDGDIDGDTDDEVSEDGDFAENEVECQFNEDCHHDDNPCTFEWCDGEHMCSTSLDAMDWQSCGEGVICMGGECVQECSKEGCDDGNPCTRDGCDINECVNIALQDYVACGENAYCFEAECLLEELAVSICPEGRQPEFDPDRASNVSFDIYGIGKEEIRLRRVGVTFSSSCDLSGSRVEAQVTDFLNQPLDDIDVNVHRNHSTYVDGMYYYGVDLLFFDYLKFDGVGEDGTTNLYRITPFFDLSDCYCDTTFAIQFDSASSVNSENTGLEPLNVKGAPLLGLTSEEICPE